MPNRNRKRLVIDATLQQRMVIEQAWPAALAVLVGVSVLGVLASNLGQEAALAGVELPSLSVVMTAAFAFVILTAVFIVVVAVRFSHRVAGPIFAIRKTLRASLDGDRDARVRLRSNDFLVDLVDDLNALLEQRAAAEPEPAASHPEESDEPANQSQH